MFGTGEGCDERRECRGAVAGRNKMRSAREKQANRANAKRQSAIQKRKRQVKRKM